MTLENSTFNNVNPLQAGITRGEFTGDGTSDRPILHGLNKVPKMVYVISYNQGGFITNMGTLSYLFSPLTGLYCSTPIMDKDYFYVGGVPGDDYGNGAGISYNWVAVG